MYSIYLYNIYLFINIIVGLWCNLKLFENKDNPINNRLYS